jgi:hypothetical protein
MLCPVEKKKETSRAQTPGGMLSSGVWPACLECVVRLLSELPLVSDHGGHGFQAALTDQWPAHQALVAWYWSVAVRPCYVVSQNTRRLARAHTSYQAGPQAPSSKREGSLDEPLSRERAQEPSASAGVSTLSRQGSTTGAPYPPPPHVPVA